MFDLSMCTHSTPLTQSTPRHTQFTLRLTPLKAYRLNYWSIHMASTKLTFGALLGTVNSAATTVTSAVSALGVGADMLNAYAQKAQRDQADLYMQEALVTQETIDAELALRLAAQAEEVTKQKAKSATFAASFDHYFALLKANRK